MVSFFLELDNVKALLPAQYHFFYPEGDNDKAVLPARYHFFYLEVDNDKGMLRCGVLFSLKGPMSRQCCRYIFVFLLLKWKSKGSNVC